MPGSADKARPPSCKRSARAIQRQKPLSLHMSSPGLVVTSNPALSLIFVSERRSRTSNDMQVSKQNSAAESVRKAFNPIHISPAETLDLSQHSQNLNLNPHNLCFLHEHTFSGCYCPGRMLPRNDTHPRDPQKHQGDNSGILTQTTIVMRSFWKPCR